MPLEFQPIEIEFGALDTDADPAEIPNGALTVAENVSSIIDGRYSKRYGYEEMTDVESDPSDPPVGAVRLAKRGSELVMLDETRCWNYDQASATWNASQPIPNAVSTQEYIAIEQSKDFFIGTRATVGGVTMHAWIESNGDLYVTLFSNADHTMVASYTDSTTDWEIVHCAVVGSRLVVFYSSVTGQLIKYCLADPATLTFGTVTTLKSTTDVYAGNVGYMYAPFDIYPISSTDVLVVYVTDTPEVQVLRRNVFAHTTGWTTTLAAEVPDGGIAVYGNEFGTAAWMSATSTAIRVRGFNVTTGAALYAATTVEAVNAATGANWNCGITRVSATSHLVVWDTRATAPPASISGAVRWRTASNGGAIGSANVKYNAWLASKPYTYNGYYYCNVFAPYDTQWTYFTLLFNSPHVAPIATHAFRTAYHGGATVACLSDIDQQSTGVFAFDAPIGYKFISATLPKAGIASFTTDFTDDKRYLSAEMGSSVFFSSSVMFRYDGGNVLENNFLLYPEVIAATPGAVGGSGMNNGVYSYILVYESADSNGNVDRSTTSLPISATTTAGAGLGKVDLQFDNLTMTHHLFSLRKISISIFRTEASGSTYYCIGSVVVDGTNPNTTYIDSANDSTITGNRIIYTQGGVLDREPAPSCKELIVHNNRMWGIGSNDPKMVFYSGDYLPGESPWFSTLQQFRVDPGGDNTALASLDDRLVIFKADRIFTVTGRGLSPTGVNSDLTPPAEISADCGCIDPRSVVQLPQGVMFQSAKGIYMLSRGGELTNIGRPVDSFLSSYPLVTAAVMHPTVQEVRYDVTNTAGDEGIKLVYNYRDNRWTTHLNWDGDSDGGSDERIDSLVLGNDYYTLDSTPAVYIETPGEFRDPADTYIPSRLATGWIKLAGKQGLVRVQRIVVLNEIQEEHDLEIDISKDYVDVVVQTASFAAADIAALPQEQIAIHVQNQQGESFKIELEDTESGAGESEGFWSRGVTFVAGVKRGSFEKVMQAGSKA